jgi:RND family efflux transporter MFP subunit
MANEDLSKLTIEKSSATDRGFRKKKPFLMIALIITALLIAFFLARKVLAPAVEIEAASVSQVYPSQSFTLLNASGYVVAQRKAAVASKITGRLVSISVEEGSSIRKGDVIAHIESEDAAAARERAAAELSVSKANFDQAKAEFADASSNHRRNKELVDKGFISRLEYDASEARYKKADAAVASAEAAIKASSAALKEAEVALEYALIRAPFDAVVLTKNADIGDIITPIGAAANVQSAVVTIADMGSLQVEVDVSESNIGQVKVSQPCEIQLDALPDMRFRGEVHMIVPTADRTKATVLVKVRFLDKDPRILPEMSAKVAFLQRQVTGEELKPRTAISPESLITRDKKTFVFLIRDGLAVETPITIGEKIGDMVEVLSGVKAGDRIILRPTDKVRNGTKVRVPEK